MKKLYFVLASITLIAVSCAKEENTPNESETPVLAKKTIKVTIQEPETKTVFNVDRTGLNWVSGDNFRLMSDTVDSSHDAQTLEYSSGTTFEPTVGGDATEVYAYYFAGTYTDANHSNPSAYTSYISPTQTQSVAGTLNGQNVPMVAKGTINGDNTVSLEFHQIASILALNIYSTAKVDGEVIDKVTIIPTANTKFAGANVLNITGNDVAYSTASTDTDYETVSLTLSTSYDYPSAKPADKKMASGQIYVAMAKQNFTTLTFVIETNKNVYRITGSNFDLRNVDVLPVNINLNSATIVDYSGTYVVAIDAGSDSYYALTPTNSSGRLAAKSISYAGSGDYDTSDGDIVWIVNKVGKRTYTIKNGSQYLTWSGSGNNASVADDAYNLTIDSNDGVVFDVRSEATQTRRFRCNTSTTPLSFAFYTSATGVADIRLLNTNYDPYQLANPATITVTPADKGFEASWDVDANVTSYSWYLTKDSDGSTVIDSQSNTTGSIDNGGIELSPSTDYTLHVKAIGTAPYKSATSFKEEKFTTEAEGVASYVATYTITSPTAVSSSGTTPGGSSATFNNTYTNNKVQMTSGKAQTLTLSGYDGAKITGITLSMHSNKSSGSGKFSAVAGSTTIAGFSSNAAWNTWYNITSWSQNDFVDVVVTMTNDSYIIGKDEMVVLTITCSANSLYNQSFKITYSK